VENGYKEITLLGQNVNSYGNDISDENVNFAALLEEIGKIEGKFRVRFMTSHPKDLSEKVVDVIAKYPNICNNIHLPIQSGSNAILAAMNRRYTREHYLDLLDMIKAKLPGVGVTTDIMVGFPGETDADFHDTLDLVERARFSNAFTFIYSPRKGTKAAEMPQLEYTLKRARIGDLIKLQNRITVELSEEYIGHEYEVLVEDIVEKKVGFVCGRTESGRLVNMRGDASLIGSFKTVRITEAHSASLTGEIL
jgi:radical SAM methylthiotransferase, MiaB/RimO family